MQLSLLPTSVSFFSKAVRDIKPNGQKANYFDAHFLFNWNVQKRGKAKTRVKSALLENATSVVVAATVVGAAATLLIRTTKAPETAKTEKPVKICEDCGGSGICAECNGEGFVLKKLSDESAEKARLTAKNMATRYTAGLPKKWSYCTKCSSARSCSTCGGRGQLSL